MLSAYADNARERNLYVTKCFVRVVHRSNSSLKLRVGTSEAQESFSINAHPLTAHHSSAYRSSNKRSSAHRSPLIAHLSPLIRSPFISPVAQLLEVAILACVQFAGAAEGQGGREDFLDHFVQFLYKLTFVQGDVLHGAYGHVGVVVPAVL